MVLSYPWSDGCVGGGLAFILKDYLKVTDPTQNTTIFNHGNPSHYPEASVNKSLHQISLQTATSKRTKFLQ